MPKTNPLSAAGAGVGGNKISGPINNARVRDRKANKDPDYENLYGTPKIDVNLGSKDGLRVMVNFIRTLDYLDMLTRNGEDQEMLERISRTGTAGVGEKKG